MQRCRRRLQLVAQVGPILSDQFRRDLNIPVRSDSKRRKITETRLPEALAILERDEGFRRRAILVPIVFILFAHPAEVDGKRRIPVRKVLRRSDARILGNEIAISGESLNRCRAGKLKISSTCFEATVFIPDVVLERDFVAFVSI